jgi:hypothetical protein
MGRLLKVTTAEGATLRARFKEAKERLATEGEKRKKFRAAYNRDPLGNELEGRSDLIASDVWNHVEGEHPTLMRRFLATDPRISFVGPDPLVCKAAKVLCRETIYDQGGFKIFTDLLKDGQIDGFGVVKLWWRRIWGPWEKKVSAGLDGTGWTGAEVEQLVASGKQVLSVHEVTAEPVLEIEDPGDDLVPPATITVEPERRYAVVVKHRELKESGVVIENLPSEEFLHEAGKKKMNDRKGCGHIRQMTVGEILREQERLSLPGEPYYLNLAEALDKATAGSSAVGDTSSLTLERIERESYHYDPTNEQAEATNVSDAKRDLRDKRWVGEWCDWVVEGDKLVPGIVTFIGETIVRAEENEEDIIPYAGWSPFPQSHHLVGKGPAEIHADEQLAHTLLLRAFMDSVGFSIDKVRMVSDASVDQLALQELYPGKVISGDINGVHDLPIAEPNQWILQAIELIKGDADERGPSTRLNQGTDAPTFNKTATGVSLIQRAAFNKVDLVALAFAELALADLYTKEFFLFQRNLDKPRTVMVDGEPVELTKEKIQGAYRARAEIGLDVDFDDRGFSKAVGLLQQALAVAQQYPMLFPPQKVRELMRRVFTAAGEQHIGELMEMDDAALQPLPQLPPQGMPPGGPGGPGVPVPPPDANAGEPPPGRDFVAGAATSQPQDTAMGA